MIINKHDLSISKFCCACVDKFTLMKFAQCFEHNVFCCFCIGVSLARILFIAIKSLMLSLCALGHATAKLPYNISEC